MDKETVTQTEQTIQDLHSLASAYLSPNSLRKIVRRPRLEIEPSVMQVPFKNETLSFFVVFIAVVISLAAFGFSRLSAQNHAPSQTAATSAAVTH